MNVNMDIYVECKTLCIHNWSSRASYFNSLSLNFHIQKYLLRAAGNWYNICKPLDLGGSWQILGPFPSSIDSPPLSSHSFPLLLHLTNIFSQLYACSVAQSCLTLCNPMDCSPPGSSVHGILPARILEWVAISFSRGSFWPRDWTLISCVSCIGRQILS